MKRPLLVFCLGLVVLPGLVCGGTPTLPSIETNNIFNVTTYGATNDGVTVNTTAIQNAINAAALATSGVGGGTVEIPGPGTYLTGALAMKTKVNIQVDAGATLQIIPESSYPNATVHPAYPLAGTNLTDVEISGSGTIDGNGAGWWGVSSSNPPYMIYFSKCQRILIQNVTLQNPPKMHISFKNSAGNVTIQGITINTIGTSPNTDGMDLIGTNCLVQNCSISDGDDNIALGSSSSSAVTANVVVTNCAFGSGHGVTIGSNTTGGVSNLLVINCTFNGTQYGIRMKSDNTSGTGSGDGGTAQNLNYYNLTMTNIVYFPILIYSYYNEIGTPTSITPSNAAAEPTPFPVPTSTVVWKNIIISNLTATVSSSGLAGLIWARTELPATNILLSHITITAPKTFEIYNAHQVTIVDSKITPTSGSTFTLYHAQVAVTNSSFPGMNPISFDGLTTTNVNGLLLYNAQASLSNTNVLGNSPVLTSGGTLLTISNSLNLTAPTVLNLLLGTTTNTIVVRGSLGLAGTVNVADGGGFGAGSYTLFTYGTNLNWGNPALGSTPSGFLYSFNTNTAKQVNLVVQSIGTTPDPPTNLTAVAATASVQLAWSPSALATSYNVKRSTSSGGPYTAGSVIASVVGSTNYTDTDVTNGVTYYYVVSALNGANESGNSSEVSATPTPSLTPLSLVFQPASQQLQVSWPADHIGWRLLIQTNGPGVGLSTNWTVFNGSDSTNQVSVPIDPANGSVFLELVYP